MKTILAIATLFLAGCATAPTADQIKAYTAAVHEAVVDYKTIKNAEKTP